MPNTNPTKSDRLTTAMTAEAVENIADISSDQTLETGQPGGRARRILQLLLRKKLPEIDREVPITRYTIEREGD